MFKRKDALSIAILVALANSGCPSDTTVGQDDVVASSGAAETEEGHAGGDPDEAAAFDGTSETSASTVPSAAVGTLPGEAGVDASGSATYSIPIEVPPGAAGMAPELAISYRSGASDGLLGIGWSLDGLGRIERCAKTRADDGAAAPVRWTNDDALCWDGMRLVAVEGATGADGTEYRTRIDRYARIIGHGPIGAGDSWFEVFTKDGRIHRFGRHADAVVRREGVPYVWTLDEVADRLGHVIEYTWASEPLGWQVDGVGFSANVEHRPTRIDYNRFGSSAPERSVAFRYVSAPPRTGWSRGAPTRRSRVLSGIDTYGPEGLVRRYEFGYDGSGTTQRQRLVSATTCDAHGQCIPATEFEWDNGSVGLTDIPFSNSYDGREYPEDTGASAASFRIMMDVNGDAATDLVYLAEPFLGVDTWRVWLGSGRDAEFEDTPSINTGVPGWAALANIYNAYRGASFRAKAIDFNDDFRDDLVFVASPVTNASYFGGQSLDLLVSQSDSVANLGFDRVEIDDGSSDIIFHALYPDLDADGRHDILLCRGLSHTESTWVYALNVPTGIGGTLSGGYRFDFDDGGVDTGVGCSVFDEYLELDRDGDGDDDLLVVPAFQDGEEIPDEERLEYQALDVDPAAGTALLVDAGLPRDRVQRWRFCNGDESGVPKAWNGAGPGQDKLADFNGDGLVDIMRYELAVGDGLDQMDAILDVFSESEACDFDNVAEAAGLRVYWNTGRGFTPGEWALQYDERRDLFHFRHASTFDYDSDGRADLLLPDPTVPFFDVENWAIVLGRPLAFVVLPTSIPGVQFENIQGYAPGKMLQPFGDHDADGIQDLGVGTTFQDVDLWQNEAGFSDRVILIENGLGERNTFEYGLSRDPEVHTTTLGCTGSEHDRCLRAVRPLVARMTVDVGLEPADDLIREYHYTGGAVSRDGRGDLGFERVRLVERQDGVVLGVTETEYDDGYDAASHDHPLAHRPTRVFHATRTNANGEADAYRYTETRFGYEHRANPTHEGVFDTVPVWREVKTWETAVPCDEMVGEIPVCEDGEPAFLWTSFAATNWAKDEFGNDVVAHTHTEDENDYDETARVYLNDEDAWIIGRPILHVDRSHTASGELQIRTQTFGYDATGLLEWAIREPLDAELFLETRVEERDPHGNPTVIVQADANENERVQELTWDAEGVYPVGSENAVGHTTATAFHRGMGVPLRHTDPNGVTVHWVFDGVGRMVQQRRTSTPNGPSDGADINVTYAPINDGDDTPRLRTRWRQAGGADEYKLHDRLGRPVEEFWVGFGGGFDGVTREYDARGRLSRESLPADAGSPTPGYYVTLFDHAGRVRSEIRPDSNDVKYTYTSAPGGGERTVNVVDEEDQSTSYRFDSRTRLVGVTDARGTQTCYTYGPFGTTTRVQRDCGGPAPPLAVKIDVDRWGRRRGFDDPNLGARAFAYDAWGGMLKEHRASGATVTWTRDALGRPLTRVGSEGPSTWTWDTEKLGMLSGSSSSDGVARAYTYDAFSRPAMQSSTIDGASFSFSHAYDGFSRLASVAHPNAFGLPFVTTYSYDVSGRLDRIRDGAIVLWDVESVDPTGRVRQERFANGVVSAKAFDAQSGRLTGLHTYDADSTIQDLVYDWSPAGDLEERRDMRPNPDHVETFSYDELHRLTKSTVSSAGANKVVEVEYNDLGDIASKSDIGAYQYVGDRLTSAGLITFGYDAEGRVISRSGSPISWTSFDRPRTIGPNTGPVSLRYDADRSRVWRHSATDGVVLTIDPRYERQITPTRTSHRYRVYAEGRVVAQLERTSVNGGAAVSTRSYVHDDHLGSTDAITDTGGNVTGRMSFDAWGRARNPNNWRLNATPTPIAGLDVGYTGHTARPDGSLIHMGARMYDPAVGRFISPDPLVTAPHDLQSWDRYSYVRNRPLRAVDPTGRSEEERWPTDPFPCVFEIVTLDGAPGAGDTDGGTDGGESGGDSSSGDAETPGDEGGELASNWDFDGTVDGGFPGTAADDGAIGPEAVVEFARGMFFGDASQGGAAYTAGHVTGSMIPYAGLGADARDIVISGGNFLFGDGSWVPLAVAAVGVIPFGDLVRFGRLGDDAIALGDDAIEASDAAALKAYGGPGGGHHVPAKSAFVGAAGYFAHAALAIPNAELVRLGVKHSVVTAAQQRGYRAFASTGRVLDWDSVARIETDALVAGGMTQVGAAATVSQAIGALVKSGVAGPTRIPWGGK